MILLIPVWIAGLFVPVYFLSRAYAPVTDADAFVFGFVFRGPATPDSMRLYRAYLSRARRYRTTCSVAGWTSAIFLTFALGGTQASFGSGDGHSVWSDILLVGFGGYLLGAVFAELHHLRRRVTGPRVVSLTPRRVDDYVPARARLFLRTMEAGSAVFIALAFVLQFTTSTAFLPAAIGYSGTALLLCGVVELTLHAIASRSRPALPDDLAAGDDAIRRAGAHALTLGAAGVSLLLTVWTASAAAQSSRGAPNSPGIALYVAISFAAFVGGVFCAFRTRRLAWPLRKIEKDGVRA